MRPTLTTLTLSGPKLCKDHNEEDLLRFRLTMQLDGLPENEERPEVSGSAKLANTIDVPIGAPLGEVIDKLTDALFDAEAYTTKDFADLRVNTHPLTQRCDLSQFGSTPYKADVHNNADAATDPL